MFPVIAHDDPLHRVAHVRVWTWRNTGTPHVKLQQENSPAKCFITLDKTQQQKGAFITTIPNNVTLKW